MILRAWKGGFKVQRARPRLARAYGPYVRKSKLPRRPLPSQVGLQDSQQRRSKWPLYLGGALFYGASVFGGFLFWQVKTAAPCECGFCEDAVSSKERRDAFSTGAASYDRSIKWVEWLSVDARRKELIQGNSAGQVLEVAAGTGRNMEHYPSTCVVTATDSNAEMLAQLVLTQKKRTTGRSVAVQQADAHDLSCFPEDSFDTCVDTFGLCSFDRPVKALQELGRVCKPEGRILLLEHGCSSPALSSSLSKWLGGSWLSVLLDRYAEPHARRWGCWWNRDIMGIVEAAGLEVVKAETYQMGTLYLVVCRPPPKKIDETPCLERAWTNLPKAMAQSQR